MIEFLIGLVGVAVLISMLLQISMISYDRTGMVIEVRNEMAQQLASGALPSSDSDYLSGWNAGADTENYTQDDSRELGNAFGFMDGMATAMDISVLAQKSELESHFPANPYLKFNDSTSGNVAEVFGIFRVDGRTEPINILPAVRTLVADIEQLVIGHDIYMPQTGNLMGEE